MKEKPANKTKTALIRREWSDGASTVEPFTEGAMHYLKETIRMYGSPAFRAKAETRLRDIAQIMSEHEMRKHQKARKEASQDEQIRTLMTDPRFASLGASLRDAAIAKEVGASASKVRGFRPKLPPGRPRKTD